MSPTAKFVNVMRAHYNQFMNICWRCKTEFSVTVFENELLELIVSEFVGMHKTLPIPSLCPECRSQKRLAFRNERNLYKRKCDYTGKDIISIYSPDTEYKIFSTDIWWTDKWDPLAYGRVYDFSRPFFEQFKELQQVVPRTSLTITNLENSPYVNQSWHSKNSHMCFDMGFSEDALYCGVTYHSKNVTDCFGIRDCELSYNLIDCIGCYNCLYLQNSKECYDSYFSFDCHNCNSIAFCSNLRNKSYHIYNKPVTKEEFQNFLGIIQTGSFEKYESLINDFKTKVVKKAVHKLHNNVNTEASQGNFLSNCKNCYMCFEGNTSEDVAYCSRLDERIFKSAHTDHCAICELVYESLCVNGNRLLFCTNCFNDSYDCIYCDYTMSTSNCFGCISLQHKKYCILNKQYSKEEYEEMVPRIIKHMQSTGEWGNFFDFYVSTFGYNETIANDIFPLKKEAAKVIGFPWKEESAKDYLEATCQIPDKIMDVNDAIVNEIFSCQTCGKNYNIVIQELRFYRELGIPSPRKCFNCRHLDRMNQRNQRKIWDSKCSKCHIPIKTSYSPDSDLNVFCEECYLKEIY